MSAVNASLAASGITIPASPAIPSTIGISVLHAEDDAAVAAGAGSLPAGLLRLPNWAQQTSDALWMHATFTDGAVVRTPPSLKIALMLSGQGDAMLDALASSFSDPAQIDELAQMVRNRDLWVRLAANPSTSRATRAWMQSHSSFPELLAAIAVRSGGDTGGVEEAAAAGDAERLAELFADQSLDVSSDPDVTHRSQIVAALAPGASMALRRAVLAFLGQRDPGAAEQLRRTLLQDDTAVIDDDLAAYLLTCVELPSVRADLDVLVEASGETLGGARNALDVLAARLDAYGALTVRRAASSGDELGAALAVRAPGSLGGRARWALPKVAQKPAQIVKFTAEQDKVVEQVELMLLCEEPARSVARFALNTNWGLPSEQLAGLLAAADDGLLADWLSGQVPHRPTPGDIEAVMALRPPLARMTLAAEVLRREDLFNLPWSDTLAIYVAAPQLGDIHLDILDVCARHISLRADDVPGAWEVVAVLADGSWEGSIAELADAATAAAAAPSEH